GGVHAGRVVDGVGVQTHARARRLDAAQLGHAQVGAFADDLGADVAAVDADGVVGLVADLQVGLARALDVGADAAEVEQFGAGLEDGLHQGDRIDRVRLDIQQ